MGGSTVADDVCAATELLFGALLFEEGRGTLLAGLLYAV